MTVNADVKIQIIPHFLSHVACEMVLHIALLCHDSLLLVIVGEVTIWTEELLNISMPRPS